MAEKATTPANLFEQLYSQTDESRAEARKPLVEKTVKRRLAAGHDNLTEQILEQEMQLEKLRSNLDNYDVDAIVECNSTITALQEAQEVIKAEYAAMFSQDFPETI